jgi:alpha-tubulin suppressor-like RCC1 family protein
MDSCSPTTNADLVQFFSINPTNAVYPNPGLYELIVTGCCSSVCTAYIGIVTNQSVTVSNSPACEGQTLYLYASYVTNATYYWTGPSRFSSNAQNPVIPNFQPWYAGSYCLSVGCLPTQICVAVDDFVPIAVVYGPSAVCARSQNIYAGPDSGPDNPDLDYSWSISGQGTIIGATSDQSIFVLAGNSGSYTLSLAISEDGGCINLATNTVSIYNEAMITTQPVSQVVCQGGSGTFSVVATGSSLSYQWQKNGVNFTNDTNISGANSATLTINNVGYLSGNGTSVVSTLAGSNEGGVTNLTVVAGHTYNYQASGCVDENWPSDPDGNTYWGSCTNLGLFAHRSVADGDAPCPGLMASSLVGEIGYACVQLGSNGSFVAPASGPLILHWNADAFIYGLGIPIDGSFTVTITPTNMVDTYDVVVTGGCKSQTSVPVSLTLASPTATVSGSATICSNESTQIRAALTGTAPWSITWSDGVTQNNIMASPVVRSVNPPGTTTYTITNVADAYCTNSATGSGSAVITITSGSAVATPSFSPEGRAYLSSLSVTVSCATAGAAIHYTTNGLTPTLDDPSISSGSAVTLSQTTILRARAFTNGYCASSVEAGLYQIGPLVVAGEYDSFFVQTNGVVWGWGDNTFAEITTNGYYIASRDEDGPTTVYTLAPMIILSNVCALSAGGAHTMAITTNGTVWSWGCGYDGNGNVYNGPGVDGYFLVDGGGDTIGPLAPVANLSNVVSVAASPVNVTTHQGSRFYDFSLALKTNGTVWAWGDNSFGESGVGNSYVFENTNSLGFSESPTPTQTVALSGVVAIAAGGDVAMALRSDGTVWVWGDYTDAFYNSYNALQSSSLHNFDTSGSTGTPMQVSGLSNIVAIALGYQHAIALDQNGFVWTWGWDSQGQLGTGDAYVNSTNGYAPIQVPGLTNVISIAAGDYHSVAVTASGQVYTWGANTDTNLMQQTVYGQLGTGSTSNYVSTPQLVSGLSAIQSASAGDAHTLALGTYEGVYLVWGWGDNTRLQLGGVTNAYVMTPVLVQFPIDTDGDGIPDWQKYLLGLNPLNPYINGDGLLNGINLEIGFNPLNMDLNSDGYSNAFNIMSGVDPFDPASFPEQGLGGITITLIEPAGAVLLY